MDDRTEHPPTGKNSLGRPAADVYSSLVASTRRQQVIDMGRDMAELTIPSVMPPDDYWPGDDLPGNNQSIGAQCVNTLASTMMFMAFPPGQPFCRFNPVVQKMSKQIAEDPELYGRVQLALSQLEVAHRSRAATTPLATAWVGYLKALLVVGNALWKHERINTPTYHLPNTYVVRRNTGGYPLLTIHEETVSVSDLDDDVQDLVLREDDELSKKDTWEQEAKIYSVCQLEGDDDDPYWCFWKETAKGKFIPGSDVETELDDCPMWPGWMIPVYGKSWGRSYCEEYRGDLYAVEANHSVLNDGAIAAGLNVTFVKPGGRTSLRQLQKARNLDMLQGDAADVTTLRNDKTNDYSFVANTVAKAERRLGSAFLWKTAVRREGERVTAEEVQQTGRELDQAMGGLYTERAQGDQRMMVSRFIHLHEEDDPDLYTLPKGLVDVQVITGLDAMGRTLDEQKLREYGKELAEIFPKKVDTVISVDDYATRLAAAKGIKPDGLVKTRKEREAEAAQSQQSAMQSDMLSQATGPVSGAIASGMMANAQQQQQQDPNANG